MPTSFGARNGLSPVKSGSGIEKRGRIDLQLFRPGLNKKLNDENLTPPEMVLRRLIDSDLDVDKGDYVLRDAYHCGVSYGIYDPDLLWENIVITDTYDIGATEKAAIEAWTLSIARYKMFHYVYKHHIRNITDALLIDIITSVLEQDVANPDKNVLPIQDLNQIKIDENLNRFVYWTDNTMLKALSEFGGPSAQRKIGMFSKRELYKRAFVISMENYPNASGNEENVIRIAREKQSEYEQKDIFWNFILFKDVKPPVLEKRVQDNIKVYSQQAHVPLAYYLDFHLAQFRENVDDIEYPDPEQKLHIFIEKGGLRHQKEVQERLEASLEHELGLGMHE